MHDRSQTKRKTETMQRACRLRCAGLSQLLQGHYSTAYVSQSSSPSLHFPTPIPAYKFERFIHIIPSSIASLRSEPQWHHMLLIATPSHPLLMIQKRTKTAKKVVKRLSAPPSKLKKTKMKSYSSYKFRFRTLTSGLIRRWRAGKRHNAHSKSKKSKRRLRQPAIVTPAYAKVMKRLNFCG